MEKKPLSSVDPFDDTEPSEDVVAEQFKRQNSAVNREALIETLASLKQNILIGGELTGYVRKTRECIRCALVQLLMRIAWLLPATCTSLPVDRSGRAIGRGDSFD